MNQALSFKGSLFIIFGLVFTSIIQQCKRLGSKEAESFFNGDSKAIAIKVKSSSYKKDKDFLGEGSFGRVFKLVSMNPPLALKAVKRKNQSQWDAKNLEREIALWPDLSEQIGQSVPKLHGCLFDESYIYILQELLYVDLEDKNFHEIFKKKTLQDRIPLLVSISNALAQLHGLKLVHNDFKLSNMMFTDNTYSHVKLIDFGFTTKDTVKFNGGTSLYNSPEKVNDLNIKTRPTVDIWAMGMTFFEILGNFDSDNIFIDRKCYKTQKFNSRCYKELMNRFDKIVFKMWKHDFSKNPYSGNINDIENIFDLVKAMLSNNPDSRPTADQIVEFLEDFLEMMDSYDNSKMYPRDQNSVLTRNQKLRLFEKYEDKDDYEILDSSIMTDEPKKFDRISVRVLRPREKKLI
jgi:serine/threonine protein kinase